VVASTSPPPAQRHRPFAVTGASSTTVRSAETSSRSGVASKVTLSSRVSGAGGGQARALELAWPVTRHDASVPLSCAVARTGPLPRAAAGSHGHASSRRASSVCAARSTRMVSGEGTADDAVAGHAAVPDALRRERPRRALAAVSESERRVSSNGSTAASAR
jgi:hypothetical protein